MSLYVFNNQQKVIKVIQYKRIVEAVQEIELNGTDELTVEIPNIDWDALEEEPLYLAVRDTVQRFSFHMYKILREDVSDDTVTVKGVQIGYDEMKAYGYFKDRRFTQASMQSVANAIVDGTDWQTGFVDSDLPAISTNFYYISRLEAIRKVIEANGCEIRFRVEITGNRIVAKRIDFLKRMSSDKGKRFSYGSKLLSVVKEKDSTELYTALVGRGRGEEVGETEAGDATYGRRINFTDVVWSKANGDPVDKPLGQEFVELPEMTALYGYPDGEPRTGIVIFEDTEDEALLLVQTYEKLVETSRPQVQFKAVVQLIGDAELGETVSIIRHDLNFKYKTRIFKVKRDLLNNNRTEIELGDRITESLGRIIKRIDTTGQRREERIIEYVQNAADGKNKIFRQETAPDTGMTVNDLWYKPVGEGEMEMYQWNGTIWELLIDTRNTTKNAEAIAEAQKGIQSAQSAADTANQQINDAINAAGFSTLADLTADIQTISNRADANALAAIDNASAAMSNALTALDNISGLESTVQNINVDIDDINGTLDLKADRQTVDTLSGIVENHTLDIQANAEGLALKADSSVVDTLSGDVSTLSTQVGLIDGELSSKISQTQLQSAIDGIEIGGRNLLKGTTNEWIELFRPEGNWFYQKGSDYKVEAGQTYTFSLIVEKVSDDTVPINLHIGLGSSPGSYTWDFPTWRRNNIPFGEKISLTYTVKESDGGANGATFFAFRLRNERRETTIRYKEVKLEKGNKATDWTPAPEDTLQLISNVETEWKQTAQGFEQSITRVETDLNGKASLVAFNTLESTVDGTIQRIGDAEGRLTTVETNVDGLQTTVSSKASQTEVTQLANAYNISVREQVSSMWTVLTNFSSGSNINYRTVSNNTVLQVDVTGNSNATSGNDNRIWSTSFTTGTIYTIAFEARKVSGTVPGRATFGQSGMGNSGWEMSIGSGWGQYGGTYTANSNLSGSLFFHVEGRYEIRNLKVFIGGGASRGQLSVLENQINLRVEKGDVMSQINIEAGRTLIETDRLYLSANTTVFGGSAFIPNAVIESLSADKITAGTIDFNTINGININVSNIVGDTTEFVRTAWNNNTSSVSIDGSGIHSIDGSDRALLANGSLDMGSNSMGYPTEVRLDGVGLEFRARNNMARMRFNGTNIVMDEANLGMNRNHINSVDWIRIIGKPGETIDTTIFNSPNHPGALIADTWQIAIGIGSRESVSRIAEFSGTINFRRNLHMNGNNIQSVSRVALNSSNTHFLSHPSSSTAGGALVDSTRFTIGIGSINTGFNDRVVVTNSQIDLRAHTNLRGFRLDEVARMELNGTNGWYMHLSSGSAIVDTRMVTIAIGNPSGVDRVADFYGRVDLYKNLNMNGNVINNQSDRRFKTIIDHVTDDVLGMYRSLDFVRFEYTESDMAKGIHFGLIAQDAGLLGYYDESIDKWMINSSDQIMYNSLGIKQLATEQDNLLKVASHAYLLAEQHEDELAEAKRKIKLLEEKVKRLEGAA